MIISTGPDKNFQTCVFLGQGFEIVSYFLFALSLRKIVFAFKDEIRRDIAVQIVKGFDPDSVQHLTDILLRVWKICKCRHYPNYFSVSLEYAAASIRSFTSEGSLILTLIIQLANASSLTSSGLSSRASFFSVTVPDTGE